MKFSSIAFGVAMALSTPTIFANQIEADNVFLDSSTLKNNLEGSLAGSIKFAQTHTIDPVDNSAQEMPHLISTRDTLVMLIPQQQVSTVTMQAFDKQGQRLGSLQMRSPDQLPAADRPVNAPNPNIIYSDRAWSQVLPADWIQPGLTLTFSADNNQSGRLAHIDIGGESQVVLQNIRIGMLTPPGPLANNPMEQQSENMAKDYFQKIPVSQLIVGNYTPLHLEEVVLSSGKKYLTRSDNEGNVYSGDLREDIGKHLISIGINNANFGINSSVGYQGTQPGLFHLVTVHQSWGNYTNGRVQHGLSGGGGMATLYNTTGNEFSHELGHTYGMGHYPGGGRGYIHSPHSGWGWDSFQNRFIANFYWNRTGITSAAESGEDYVVPPFKGIHKFNRDTMGGGEHSSPLSQYTLHTGYTQKRIQQQLERTGVINPLSSTGYSIWDSNKQEMVEASGNQRRKPVEYGVPVTTLIGYYDPKAEMESYVYPALHGSYGYVYQPQAPVAGECWADVSYRGHETERFALLGVRQNASYMNKFHINVPTSKHPQSIRISCPQQDISAIYNHWKLQKLNTPRYHYWSGDRDAALGSVFIYPGNPDRYYRLKAKPYGYYPGAGQSNHHWQYITDDTALNSEFRQELSHFPHNYYGEREVAQRHIDAASVAPMPAAVVGHLFEKETSAPPVADAGENFTVTGTTDFTRNYPLNGSGSRNAISYRWTVEEGNGDFFFKKEHTNEWTNYSDMESPQALVPAHKFGHAVFLLTVTGRDGTTSQSRVRMTVNPPVQHTDRDYLNGLNLNISITPLENMARVTAQITAGTNSPNTPHYYWSLPTGAQPAAQNMPQHSFTIARTERQRRVPVTVRIVSGLEARELHQMITIPAKGPVAPGGGVGTPPIMKP